MIGYPNFIMDPKELDKVFNDVSGFHPAIQVPTWGRAKTGLGADGC